MTLPDDGAFLDDVDGDMAEQEAITAIVAARRQPITTEGCDCPDGPDRCRFLPLIEFANRVGWTEIDAWMFMGTAQADDLAVVSCYKHRDTRQYLNAAPGGHPYVGGHDLRADETPFYPYRPVTDVVALRIARMDRQGNPTW